MKFPDASAVAAALAAPLSVTVVPLPGAAGLIAPEIVQRGATMFKENVLVTPPALAVRVAAWSVGTVATVAVNAELDDPDGTVTLPGTVALELLLARATANPPAGAAVLRPTLQAEVPGAFTPAGEQERLLRTACVAIVIVPPAPEDETALPDPSETTTAPTPTGNEPLPAAEEILNVAVARVPLPMTLVFNPDTTHVVLPLALEHDTVLPAAVALDPAVTLTPETTEDEYVIVHCAAVGCAVPEFVKERLKLTLPPAAELPEPSDNAVCAMVWL